MSDKAKKRLLALFAFVAASLCVVVVWFCYLRVNDAYPNHDVVRHALGEQVTLCVLDEEGVAASNPDVTLRIEEAAMFSAGEFMAAFPDYTDQMLATGQADDARFVVVKGTVENASDEVAKTLLGNAAIQSGSYTNGIEYSLYRIFNDDNGSFAFEPHSSNVVYLTYAMYDASFGFNATWDSIDGSSFELVTSLYPNKEYVDLGVVGGRSLSEGEEEGVSS